jgi:hypothetical protein
VKHHILGPDQQADTLAPLHQHVHHRKPVVDPRPRHPQRQHERRADTAQRLVEIGAVLFADGVQTGGANRRPGCSRHGIEIADHRLGQMPPRNRPVGPAIRRDQPRRTGAGKGQVAGGHRAARHQRDPFGRFDNRVIHRDTVLN